MSRLLAGLVLLASLGPLAGCGGPPTQFYTLDAVPPAGAARMARGRPVPVQVGHVEIPAALDRAALVRQLGPGRLDVSGQDRWAAPLDGQMRDILAQDLRLRLAPVPVLAPGDPQPSGGVRTVTVNVLRFIPGPDGTVTLQADWAVQQPRRDTPGMVHHEDIRVPAASARTPAVVEAMAHALGLLADRIAGGL